MNKREFVTTVDSLKMYGAKKGFNSWIFFAKKFQDGFPDFLESQPT